MGTYSSTVPVASDINLLATTRKYLGLLQRHTMMGCGCADAGQPVSLLLALPLQTPGGAAAACDPPYASRMLQLHPSRHHAAHNSIKVTL